MTALLEAKSLTYSYPGSAAALSGLNLTITRGRRLAILGPNGAGKTTLLLHLNGTLRPASGQILLDGAPAGYGRDALIDWRRRIGLVLQDADDQLFAASVAQDVSFGPLNLGLGEARTRERVAEALRALDICDLADRPTHMLSFGQKKRAAIAGALAMRPEILLLDEPTAGLDNKGAAKLLAELQRLHAAGTTLVFSTHDADFAWSFAEDVALFRNGEVFAQGPAEALLVDAEKLAEAGITTPLLGRVGMALRAKGLLPPGAPLPRKAEELLSLLGEGE
jgi:cobalt/nickel transport system ATP-binding protein